MELVVHHLLLGIHGLNNSTGRHEPVLKNRAVDVVVVDVVRKSRLRTELVENREPEALRRRRRRGRGEGRVLRRRRGRREFNRRERRYRRGVLVRAGLDGAEVAGLRGEGLAVGRRGEAVGKVALVGLELGERPLPDEGGVRALAGDP